MDAVTIDPDFNVNVKTKDIAIENERSFTLKKYKIAEYNK